MLAICAGLRRGEILGLKWCDLDPDRAVLSVRRSLEETTAGVRFKEPKSRSGRREVALPELALDALKDHCARQKGFRDLLGKGYQENDLICCIDDGSVWKPSAFTSSYRSLLKRRNLTGPNFHAIRHAHVSQLLKAGIDAKVISKRLGHSRASFTMDVNAHLMPGQDQEAAKRTDTGLRKALESAARVAG